MVRPSKTLPYLLLLYHLARPSASPGFDPGTQVTAVGQSESRKRPRLGLSQWGKKAGKEREREKAERERERKEGNGGKKEKRKL